MTTILDLNRNDESIMLIIEKAVECAYECVSINRNILNNLNVFPVPDGDTGYNMSLTIAEGFKTAKRDGDNALNFLDIFSTRCMNMSRGNSGIIIARFIRGFIEVILENGAITYESILKGFEKGSDYARKSMIKPKEGTMITIIDESYRLFSKYFNENYDIHENYKKTIEGTIKKLYETPDILPVLGKGGVVDSGALGFIYFMKGLLCGLEGRFPKEDDESKYHVEVREVDESEIEINKMRYCFEFTVNCGKDGAEKIKEQLMDMGDSLSVTNSEEITKVHIHTNDTDAVKNVALQEGTLGGIKIDDMFAQTERYSTKSKDLPEILAILPGNGYKAVFSDLNVSYFLVYEDRLPTTGEVETKINSINSDNVIVIVNNNNILPSVKLCQENMNKGIFIIPSKNIAEGITALFDFNPVLNAEENISAMKESLEYAPIFIKLAKSIKDKKFGDVNIKKDDYFTIQNDNVIVHSQNFYDVIVNTLKHFDMEDKSIVSLYYNRKIDESMVNNCSEKIKNEYPDVDVEIYFGGQKESLIYLTIE